MTSSVLRSVIGTISGTSMDGIDVAWVETDGRDVVRPRGGALFPYPSALRLDLSRLLDDPSRAAREPLVEIENAVTDAFAAAIEAFLQQKRIARTEVDLVGLHGQTVYHRPEQRFTRQLGSGERLARRLGIDVIDSFRHADVAAGGQGAPLAPLYHRALAVTLPQPLIVLNLGGVGNITYLDGDTILAFDTGPASALIDDHVSRHFGVAFDEDGRIAARGRVDGVVLGALMANPFFDVRPPKSLDRNDFHRRAAIVARLSPEDAAATLTAFTIEATVAALRHVPRAPVRWLVTGGGRNNAAIMSGLVKRLGVPVEPVEAVGWNGDTLEAELFAYLAVRAVDVLPLSLPTTTGVPTAMTGGTLWMARPSA